MGSSLQGSTTDSSQEGPPPACLAMAMGKFSPTRSVVRPLEETRGVCLSVLLSDFLAQERQAMMRLSHELGGTVQKISVTASRTGITPPMVSSYHSLDDEEEAPDRWSQGQSSLQARPDFHPSYEYQRLLPGSGKVGMIQAGALSWAAFATKGLGQDPTSEALHYCSTRQFFSVGGVLTGAQKECFGFGFVSHSNPIRSDHIIAHSPAQFNFSLSPASDCSRPSYFVLSHITPL